MKVWYALSGAGLTAPLPSSSTQTADSSNQKDVQPHLNMVTIRINPTANYPYKGRDSKISTSQPASANSTAVVNSQTRQQQLPRAFSMSFSPWKVLIGGKPQRAPFRFHIF